MRISSKKFKDRLADAGVSKDELAQAIDREGLSGDKARAAVDHWLNGASRPVARKGDIANLAQKLGCEPTDIVDYESTYRFNRASARKVRLVTDMIRGKRIDQALTALDFSKKRAAIMVRKALEAAIASATDPEQGDLESSRVREMVVSEARVDEGPTIKRWQPKDRGRAHPILKRTSHIHVAVAEK